MGAKFCNPLCQEDCIKVGILAPALIFVKLMDGKGICIICICCGGTCGPNGMAAWKNGCF